METAILSLEKCSTRKVSVDYKKGSLKFEIKLGKKNATKLSWINQTLFSVCILLVTICTPNVVKGEEIENLQNNVRRSSTKVSQNQSVSRNLISTEGWTRVRHVPKGYKWHSATDQLRGTHVYGSRNNDNQNWSINFDHAVPGYNEFLFATGDKQKWLIAKKDEVMGFYANELRSIIDSSQPNVKQARWYRRHGALEDPWISITDHGPAISRGDIVYGENNFGHTHASATLPIHNGADVYIRRTKIDSISTEGWTRVRHVPKGYKWHSATDQLRGTHVYGSRNNDNHNWSINFDHAVPGYNEFLFATGDKQKWLIAKRDEVMGFYANEFRSIIDSSQPNVKQARWYRRHGVLEDPWISITDHGPAISRGDIVYGENNFARTHASATLPIHNGADVYIRRIKIDLISTEGWTRVRHVPKGYNWHSATDQLRGTQVYGSRNNDNQNWSIIFENAVPGYNEFLFATGDKQKWLIAKKTVVRGFYANELRSIIDSSQPNIKQARWYRRHGALEDPWISITDHGPATSRGDIVYGENNFAHTHASTTLPIHNGADVYIRRIKINLDSKKTPSGPVTRYFNDNPPDRNVLDCFERSNSYGRKCEWGGWNVHKCGPCGQVYNRYKMTTPCKVLSGIDCPDDNGLGFILEFSKLIPVAGDLVSAIHGVVLIAEGDYEAGAFNLACGIAGLALGAYGSKFGLKLAAAKMKFSTKSPFLNARFAQMAVRAKSGKPSLLVIQSQLGLDANTRAQFLVYVNSMSVPELAAKIQEIKPNGFEPPIDFDLDPQENLNIVNRFEKSENSIMKNQCDNLEFPGPLEKYPVDYKSDLKVHYTMGAVYFHIMLAEWASTLYAKAFHLQYLITGYLLGFIDEARLSSRKIDCEVAHWKIQGFLDRMESCLLFNGAPLKYNKASIEEGGYPFNIC